MPLARWYAARVSSAAYLIAPERFAQPHFVLRSRRPGDGAQVAEAINASYEHLKVFMAWAKPDQSVEHTEKLSREFYAKWLQATDFPIAIWDRAEARILGGCGYHLREGPLELGNAEIGMWIRADAAGRGLGTAVLGALLHWGFTDWPWLRLSWRCSSANAASQRVAEKAGLRLEGVLRSHAIDPNGVRRDTLCYAILRDDWLAQPQP